MKKDKETFLQLLKQHKGIVLKVCNAYCSEKSDRDDLVQEIVFNLWKSFERYEHTNSFSTWVYRIALNVAISFYRKEKRTLQFSPFSENLMVYAEDESGHQELENNLVLLQEYIHELKALDKSIMLLYLDNKSHREIAEITGISESNVGTKIGRIKVQLKSKFNNN